MTDAAPAADLLARLQAAGAGDRVWLPVNGHAFAPLLRGGDSVGVERCTADALRRGDLVLVRRHGAWEVTVVAETDPLRTGTLRGVMDEHSGEVHGRVATVRRRGRTHELGAPRRMAAWAMQRTAWAARRVLGPPARFVRSSPATRGVRGRRLGPVRIRRVAPDDAAALDAFAAESLPRMREFIARQVRGRWRTQGAVVAAVDARGTVRGFTFVDEYAVEGVALPGHWVRGVAVSPWARRLGLGRELVRESCAAAHRGGVRLVYADIREDNAASIALFRGLGFTDAPPELVAAANRVLVPAGEVRRTVLQAALPLPGADA